MFWTARTLTIGMFILSSLFLMASGLVGSETWNPVSVQISSICRYQIERIGTVPQIDSEDTVETVNISVLNNSNRPWRLMVCCNDNSLHIDWSVDGVRWRKLDSEPVIIITGYRSLWNNYRIFYRYHEAASVGGAGFQYQVLFSD